MTMRPSRSFPRPVSRLPLSQGSLLVKIRSLLLPLSVIGLAGCSAVVGTLGIRTGGPVTVEVVPQFKSGGFRAQALVTPYASSSVDHLVVTLHRRDDQGGETAVTSGGLPIEKDVASGSLTVPLRFMDLHQNTKYRIRAAAYRAPGRDAADLISVASASYADLDVGMDDRPQLANLPVQLVDRLFSGQASASIDFTAGGLVHSGVETIAYQDIQPELRPEGTLKNFASYATLPYPLQRTAPLQIGDKLYLFGGTTVSGVAVNTSKILVSSIGDDGMLGPFTEVAGRTLVSARSGHYATRVGNYVYLIGGIDPFEGTAMASVERAAIGSDGTLGAFETVAGGSLNTARGLFTGYNTGSYVYAIGGRNPYLDTVERAPINPDGTLGPFTVDSLKLKVARMSAGGVRVGRYLYMVGGEGFGGQLNTLERATVNSDGTLGAFALDARTLSSRRNRMGSVVLADKIYFFGGFDDGFLSAVDSATINADDTFGPFAITNTTSLVTGLENGVTFLTRNAVYYLGGYNGSILNTIQRAPIE